MAENKTFEASLKDLESAVEKLESGDLPLEDALVCFEEGVKAAGSCQKLLQEAELKVEKLRMVTGKKPVAEPFEVDGGGS